MKLSLIAILLWAAGFLGNTAVLAVLLIRRRVRVVPWFTSWIVFNLSYTLVLFGAYRLGNKHVYSVLYWSGAFVDLVLQASLVFEIAGYVFKRGGGWVERARARLLWAGLLAIVVAVGLGAAMTPAATSRVEAWQSRVDLSATVLISVLFTSVMVISHQLGVSWRSLALREGYGVAVWSVFTFLTDTLHAYWRTAAHFSLLDHFRIVVYLAALGYWAVIFWLPDAALLVPSAAAKKHIQSTLKGLQ